MPAAVKKMSKSKEEMVKPTIPTSPSNPAHPAHQTYSTMVLNAVVDGGRLGASRPAILKHVFANCAVGDVTKTEGYIKRALKQLIETEQIVPAASKGRKGSGSFKLAVQAVVKKPKAKSARKPVARKSTPKKVAAAKKEPVAKKTAAKK